MLKKSLFVLLLGVSSAVFACQSPSVGDVMVSSTGEVSATMGEAGWEAGDTRSESTSAPDVSAPSTDTSTSSSKSDSSSGSVCSIM
jgi:hypothetical protein